MEIFTQGTVICMKKGDAVVKECLRDYGEQLYRVDYNGANKILVWISHTSWCRQYYQNVQNIVNIGNIYEGFLWPEDISEMHDDKFGYIVSIISKDYVPMYEILALKHNLNYKVLVAASIHLAKAVSSLSKYGLVIYGFTSFNIDISKGEILIPMDATACVPSETKLAWIDNPRYTAPEVALGAPMNLYSNRFILANLIFQLLFFSHPLEGIRSLAPMNTDLQMKIYAEEPVFIFDREDDINKPHPVIQKNTILLWERAPAFVKDIFWRAFDKDAIKNLSHRPTEKNFLYVLKEFYSVLSNKDRWEKIM